MCYKLLVYFVFLSIKLLGSGINLGKVLQCENILHLTIFSILSFSSLVHFLTSISIKLISVFLFAFSHFLMFLLLYSLFPCFLHLSFSISINIQSSRFLTSTSRFFFLPLSQLSFLILSHSLCFFLTVSHPPAFIFMSFSNLS